MQKSFYETIVEKYLRYPTESSNLLVILFLEQTPELYQNACNISYRARCKVKKKFFQHKNNNHKTFYPLL